jgi:hypothetical protein
VSAELGVSEAQAESGVWAAWAVLEVSAEPAAWADQEAWAGLAAIAHHNCRPAVAEHGSTTQHIAEELRIGTVPQQTGLGVRRAVTHLQIVRPAPASSLAARGAIFPATAEAEQA